MVKISNLPAVLAASISTDDLLPMVDLTGNVTDKVTVQQLITYFFNNIPSGTIPGSVFDYVISGGVWSGDSYGSNRNASMTAISIYINGRTIAITAVTARTFTASKDTYIDVLDNLDGTGTLVYTEVANNAASPALASNSLRIGIIVTGATTIANAGSVNQGQQDKVLPISSSIPYAVTDSLGNLICPRDPSRKLLGYRQAVANITSASATEAAMVPLTCPVIVPTGRKVIVSLYAGLVSNDNVAGLSQLRLWETAVTSGTQIQQSNYNQHSTASESIPMYLEALVTPTSTSRTYVGGIATNGTGTTTVNASTSVPVYIKVELE